jgi:Xaa-Pro aminopeptidase
MELRPGQDTLARRRERLRALLASRKLRLLVVSNPVNIFYLTGFRGSAGIAAVTHTETFLWVDPRYVLQAREQAQGVEITEVKGNPWKAVGAWLGDRSSRAVAYEDGHLTCAAFRELRAHASPRLRLTPAGNLVEELRYVKDADEIEQVRKAARLTSAVFEEAMALVQPGVRESDLAAEIDYRMRRAGAEGAAFETIVASGPRSAWPHARASAKLLNESELVILDLGAIVEGYAADMARTLYLGKPQQRVRDIYSAVQEAQKAAIESVRSGVSAGEVDRAARKVLERRGLAGNFTHSTGHGVGLEVHERPRLGQGESQGLAVGCVLAVEPGVYLEGFGGIRLEDTILVGDKGAEILTPATKDNWFVA